MTVRNLFPLAAAFGLWVAGPAAAQQPMPASAAAKAEQPEARGRGRREAPVERGGPEGGQGERGDAGRRRGVVRVGRDHASSMTPSSRRVAKVPGLRRIESGVQVGDASPVRAAGGQVEVGGTPPGGFSPVQLAPPPMGPMGPPMALPARRRPGSRSR